MGSGELGEEGSLIDQSLNQSANQNKSNARAARTISGSRMCGHRWRARSRYAFIAIRMLSVPPEVTLPAVSASPCNMSAVMATVSFSNFL